VDFDFGLRGRYRPVPPVAILRHEQGRAMFAVTRKILSGNKQTPGAAAGSTASGGTVLVPLWRGYGAHVPFTGLE
jgi:hypothetical protein